MVWKSGRVALVCLAVIGAAVVLTFVVHFMMPPPAVLARAEAGPVVGAGTSDSCAADAVGYDTWVTCTAMATGRNGAAAAAVGDVIFVMGGSQEYSSTSTTEAYDTMSDTWASVVDMPTARTGLASATLNEEVYAIGGWTTVFISPTEVVEVYSPISGSWTTVAALPSPRGGLAAVAVHGKVYAIGGSDGFGSVTNTVTVYDPVSDTWEYRASMPTARSGLAVVAVGDTIFAIGGSGGTSPTAKLEVYDTVGDSWAIRTDMPISCSALAAAVVDGKVYIVGGTDSGFYPASYLGTNQEYDPVADTWRTVAPMPTPRWALVAVAVDGKVYAIGGSSDATTFETANEVYLPPGLYQAFLPLTPAMAAGLTDHSWTVKELLTTVVPP